jgi:hypothetical protein
VEVIMKWAWFSIVLLMLVPRPVEAGVNSGGVLVVHDPGLSLALTNGSVSLCGQGTVPTACDDGSLDARIDGANSEATAVVWKVYAAFSPSASPRLTALTWGITYPWEIVLLTQGSCGWLDAPDAGWPASDTGCAVAWSTTQTTRMVPVYWFAGYSYAASASFTLRGQPSQGGTFCDDSMPPVLDNIAGYGSLGFDRQGSNPRCDGGAPSACCFTQVCLVLSPNDCSIQGGAFTTGYSCAPSPCLPSGACCNPSTGSCTITLQAACQTPNVWHAEWTVCSPNPCPPIGACCLVDGSCQITTAANCPGTWMMGGSCMPNPCPQAIGACCFTTTCLFIGLESCYSQGGNFMGYSSTCNPSPCVPIAVGDRIRGAGDVELGPPVPNPTWGTVQYSIVLPRSEEVRVSLLDVSGRIVRELLARPLSAGMHTFSWDPEDAGGRRLPSGMYALRLETGDSVRRVRRLVLLR